MSVISYPKHLKEKLSTDFNAIEFKCPCQDCKLTLIDSDLVTKLQLMRDKLACKLTITSGYRCPAYQQQLRIRGFETAKGISQHCLGKAADVTNGILLGAELEEAARKSGFQAVGVGKNWCHVDTRTDTTRRWFYNK